MTLYPNLIEWYYSYRNTWCDATEDGTISILYRSNNERIGLAQLRLPSTTLSSLNIDSVKLYLYIDDAMSDVDTSLYLYCTNVSQYIESPYGDDFGNISTTGYIELDITSLFNGLSNKDAVWYLDISVLCDDIDDIEIGTNGTSSPGVPYIVVNYIPPFTACSAPTSVLVDNSLPLIGTTVELSWSGAVAGTNNPITKFEIYRSATFDGTYTYIDEISTSNTYGSKSGIIIPTTIGGTYFFKIKTIGTESGYDSDLSVYVQITTSAPTIHRKGSGSTLEAMILKRHNGTSWVIMKLERHDGSSWKLQK